MQSDSITIPEPRIYAQPSTGESNHQIIVTLSGRDTPITVPTFVPKWARRKSTLWIPLANAGRMNGLTIPISPTAHMWRRLPKPFADMNPTDCWHFKGYENRRPSGILTHADKSRHEHCYPRIAMLKGGVILPRLLLGLHICGDFACVNIRHGYIGTHLDNKKDEARHAIQGRNKHPNEPTMEQMKVWGTRALWDWREHCKETGNGNIPTIAEIQAHYGFKTPKSVRDIGERKTYRHIPEEDGRWVPSKTSRLQAQALQRLREKRYMDRAIKAITDNNNNPRL